MSSTSTTPATVSIDADGARRERSPLLRGIVRLLGLGALWAALGRGLLRTRTRKVAAAAVASAVLVAAGLALVVPTVESIYRTPGQGEQRVGGDAGVGSGYGDVDVSKLYPRLYSPKLGIDVAILPGDGKAPPVRPIAWQYPGTAALGDKGNTYLYAHDRPGMFFGLHSARVGDVLIVARTPTDKLYFQVTEIHADVAWNDLEWLRPSDDQRLTLQTCNYSGDYDPRYIVVTRPISADEGRRLTGDA